MKQNRHISLEVFKEEKQAEDMIEYEELVDALVAELNEIGKCQGQDKQEPSRFIRKI